MRRKARLAALALDVRMIGLRGADPPFKSSSGRTMKRLLGVLIAVCGLTLFIPCALAQESGSRVTPESVLDQRYRLVLDLVRHTAPYPPPVASRAFAYLGVIAFEV